MDAHGDTRPRKRGHSNRKSKEGRNVEFQEPELPKEKAIEEDDNGDDSWNNYHVEEESGASLTYKILFFVLLLILGGLATLVLIDSTNNKNEDNSIKWEQDVDHVEQVDEIIPAEESFIPSSWLDWLTHEEAEDHGLVEEHDEEAHEFIEDHDEELEGHEDEEGEKLETGEGGERTRTTDNEWESEVEPTVPQEISDIYEKTLEEKGIEDKEETVDTNYDSSDDSDEAENPADSTLAQISSPLSRTEGEEVEDWVEADGGVKVGDEAESVYYFDDEDSEIPFKQDPVAHDALDELVDLGDGDQENGKAIAEDSAQSEFAHSHNGEEDEIISGFERQGLMA